MHDEPNAAADDAGGSDSLDRKLQIGRPELGTVLDGLRARMIATAGGVAPRTIGRYRLGRVIGSGSFGTVYEAEDPELDRRVAVKLLGVRSAKESARVLREARLLATLSHPNVVQVFEVGITDDGRSPYVVMELVEGPTLRTWMNEGAHGWRDVVEIVLGVARGLQAAHEAGVIHRDLKPENVLMGRDGRPRVIDFGLARTIDDEGSTSEGTTLMSGANERARASGSAAAMPHLTATGQVLGTPAYMAPEVFAGEHGPLSDQYALCVALYEALYGERPFSAESPEALARKVHSQEAELPADRRGVPRRVGRIALRGLRRSPRERFGDLGQVMKALESSLRPRRWPVAAAGLAGLGVSGLVIAGMQPPAETPAADECAKGDAAFVRLREQVTIPAEVEAQLSSYQRAWVEAEQSFCEAGSGAMAWELRRCLDRGLGDASALVSLLGEPEVDVAGIVEGLESSQSPADCDDPKLEISAPPAGVDLEPLEQRLSHVRALTYAAKYEAAFELSGPLVEDVRAAGHAPLLADAAYMRARLLLLRSDYEGARAMFEEAYFIAQQSGPSWLAAWASSELLRLHLTNLEDVEEARRWAGHAETALRRAGFDPLEHHVYVDAMAGLYGREGKADQAVRFLRAAIESQEARGEFNGGLANRLGLIHYEREEYYEAIAALRKAEAVFAELHGPHAPSVATAIDAIGVCLVSLGHYRAAHEHHVAAMKIREATLSPDHVELGMSYGNVGEALRHLGRIDESLEYQERSRALFVARLGDEHPLLGTADQLLGMTHAERGRDGRTEARQAYERSIRRFEAAGPTYAKRAEEVRKLLAELDAPARPKP